MEKQVQAWYQLYRQIRTTMRRRDAEGTISTEADELAVKKSRYCFTQARTANRHRWMRRES